MEYLSKRLSVALLDPSIASRNAGDEIIAEASRRAIVECLPNHFISTVPTHESVGARSYRIMRQSEYSIVGGSNILSSNIAFDRGWRVGFKDYPFVSNLILLAVGWRDYQKQPGLLSKMLLSKILSKTAIHSVRDQHTAGMLRDAGFNNVVVTSCVTMWGLTPDHISQIPRQKSESVVTTFNVHKSSPADQVLADLLVRTYKDVFVWPQGFDDLDYVRSLFGYRAQILPGNLEAYDGLLRSDRSLDFVGARLHGGIRALQHGRRALIVAIDNRAAEIGKDTGLPVVFRMSPVQEIEALILGDQTIDISLPHENIQTWRDQFR